MNREEGELLSDAAVEEGELVEDGQVVVEEGELVDTEPGELPPEPVTAAAASLADAAALAPSAKTLEELRAQVVSSAKLLAASTIQPSGSRDGASRGRESEAPRLTRKQRHALRQREQRDQREPRARHDDRRPVPPPPPRTPSPPPPPPPPPSQDERLRFAPPSTPPAGTAAFFMASAFQQQQQQPQQQQPPQHHQPPFAPTNLLSQQQNYGFPGFYDPPTTHTGTQQWDTHRVDYRNSHFAPQTYDPFNAAPPPPQQPPPPPPPQFAIPQQNHQLPLPSFAPPHLGFAAASHASPQFEPRSSHQQQQQQFAPPVFLPSQPLLSPGAPPPPPMQQPPQPEPPLYGEQPPLTRMTGQQERLRQQQLNAEAARAILDVDMDLDLPDVGQSWSASTPAPPAVPPAAGDAADARPSALATAVATAPPLAGQASAGAENATATAASLDFGTILAEVLSAPAAGGRRNVSTAGASAAGVKTRPASAKPAKRRKATASNASSRLSPQSSLSTAPPVSAVPAAAVVAAPAAKPPVAPVAVAPAAGVVLSGPRKPLVFEPDEALIIHIDQLDSSDDESTPRLQKPRRVAAPAALAAPVAAQSRSEELARLKETIARLENAGSQRKPNSLSSARLSSKPTGGDKARLRAKVRPEGKVTPPSPKRPKLPPVAARPQASHAPAPPTDDEGEGQSAAVGVGGAPVVTSPSDADSASPSDPSATATVPSSSLSSDTEPMVVVVATPSDTSRAPSPQPADTALPTQPAAEPTDRSHDQTVAAHSSPAVVPAVADAESEQAAPSTPLAGLVGAEPGTATPDSSRPPTPPQPAAPEEPSRPVSPAEHAEASVAPAEPSPKEEPSAGASGGSAPLPAAAADVSAPPAPAVTEQALSEQRTRIREQEELVKQQQQRVLQRESELSRLLQEIGNVQSRRAYQQLRAKVLREQLLALESQLEEAAREEQSLDDRVSELVGAKQAELESLAAMRSQLEVHHLKLAEAEVDWAVSREVAGLDTADAAGLFRLPSSSIIVQLPPQAVPPVAAVPPEPAGSATAPDTTGTAAAAGAGAAAAAATAAVADSSVAKAKASSSDPSLAALREQVLRSARDKTEKQQSIRATDAAPGQKSAKRSESEASGRHPSASSAAAGPQAKRPPSADSQSAPSASTGASKPRASADERAELERQEEMLRQRLAATKRAGETSKPSTKASSQSPSKRPKTTSGAARSAPSSDTSRSSSSSAVGGSDRSSAEAEPLPPGLRDLMWTSPLLRFRSYRLSPHYRLNYKLKLTSLTYSHLLDPDKNLCRWELLGVCNDDGCVGQHERQYRPSDAAVLQELASYKTASSAEEREMIDTYVKALASATSRPLEARALELVKRINTTASHPHYIVFPPSPEPAAAAAADASLDSDLVDTAVASPLSSPGRTAARRGSDDEWAVPPERLRLSASIGPDDADLDASRDLHSDGAGRFAVLSSSAASALADGSEPQVEEPSGIELIEAEERPLFVAVSRPRPPRTPRSSVGAALLRAVSPASARTSDAVRPSESAASDVAAPVAATVERAPAAGAVTAAEPMEIGASSGASAVPSTPPSAASATPASSTPAATPFAAAAEAAARGAEMPSASAAQPQPTAAESSEEFAARSVAAAAAAAFAARLSASAAAAAAPPPPASGGFSIRQLRPDELEPVTAGQPPPAPMRQHAFAPLDTPAGAHPLSPATAVRSALAFAQSLGGVARPQALVLPSPAPVAEPAPPAVASQASAESRLASGSSEVPLTAAPSPAASLSAGSAAGVQLAAAVPAAPVVSAPVARQPPAARMLPAAVRRKSATTPPPVAPPTAPPSVEAAVPASRAAASVAAASEPAPAPSSAMTAAPAAQLSPVVVPVAAAASPSAAAKTSPRPTVSPSAGSPLRRVPSWSFPAPVSVFGSSAALPEGFFAPAEQPTGASTAEAAAPERQSAAAEVSATAAPAAAAGVVVEMPTVQPQAAPVAAIAESAGTSAPVVPTVAAAVEPATSAPTPPVESVPALPPQQQPTVTTGPAAPTSEAALSQPPQAVDVASGALPGAAHGPLPAAASAGAGSPPPPAVAAARPTAAAPAQAGVSLGAAGGQISAAPPVPPSAPEHTSTAAAAASAPARTRRAAESEYESALSEQPKNVALWLDYAAKYLHGFERLEAIPAVSHERNLALQVLSRALENNQRSFPLWAVYLRLYSTTKNNDVMELFEQAVRFMPHSHGLWLLLADAAAAAHAADPAAALRRRVSVYERALRSIVGAVVLDRSAELLSAQIADLVLRSVKAFCDANLVGDAAAALELLLATGEWRPLSAAPQRVTADAAGLRIGESELLETDWVRLALLHVQLATTGAFPEQRAFRAFSYTLDSSEVVIDWRACLAQPGTDRDSSAARAKAQLDRWLQRIAARGPLSMAALPLCLNIVALEVELRSWDEARRRCQTFLRATPSLAPLWIMYARVEALSANDSDAQMIYERSIQRFPRAFALVEACAEWLVQRGDRDRAIVVLAKAALGLLLKPSQQMIAFSQSAQAQLPAELVPTALAAYSSLLGREAADGAPPVFFSEDAQRLRSLPRDPHAWACWCLLLWLAGSRQATLEAYNEAVDSQPEASHRALLWLRFARLLRDSTPVDDAVFIEATLARAFAGVSPVQFGGHSSFFDDLPALAELPGALRRQLTAEPSQDSFAKDYSFHDRLLDMLLPSLPRDRWAPLCRSLLAHDPDNVALRRRLG